MNASDVPSAHDDVIHHATALASLLAEQASEAEKQRKLTPTVLAAAAGAELFRMVVPQRWGGNGLGLETLAEATRILGRGCPASAWTLSFLILHNWLLTRFSERLQEEVFGERGYALMAAPLAPVGRLEPIDGGYQLAGRWEWATGINHADWVMVQALEMREGAPHPRFAVLKRDEVVVEDVWFTSGMRATGSNAVRVELAIPEYRTVAAAELGAGRPPELGNRMAIYPMLPALVLVAAAPALGAAESAVEIYKQLIQDRVLAYGGGDKGSDQSAAQIRLATAVANVRAAGTVFDRTIADLGCASRSADGVRLEDRVNTRLAAADIVRLAHAAISLVCAGAGARIYYDTSPLQRLQRDVEVLKGHVVFDWDRTAELVGRVLLGLTPRPTDLV